MAEPKVSFQDFDWACGHTGPAVCAQCWDAKLAEIERLRAVLKESCICSPYVDGPCPTCRALQTKDSP